MVNLFRAEWIKIAGNRWVAGCLVWIFPIAAAGFIVIVSLILALSGAARDGFAEETVLWTDNAVGVWNFPNNPVGRIILLAFTAVVFAGEYQWSTWKNVVPRNQRARLVLVKFVTLGVFVVLAFLFMSIIYTLGWGLLTEIAGTSYGPRITGSVLKDFAQDYLVQAATTFTSTIIAAGYAALAGMVTRSILGGIVAAFIATMLETVLILGLALVGWLLNVPKLVHVYRFTPMYNLLNVSSWINDNKPSALEIDIGDTVINHTDSLEFSLVVLTVWVVGLIVLIAFLFQRQDITS